MKAIARYVKRARAREFCRKLRARRTKHHFPLRTTQTGNPNAAPKPCQFALEQRPGYDFFGYGNLETISESAIFYVRMRRCNVAEPRLCVQTRRRNREELAKIILLIERRGASCETWRTLLTGNPTHVLRFGYQHQPTGRNFDTIDLYLCFDFHGWNKDGLAKAFGEQFLKGIERNLSMTWYLCPNAANRQAAALFWMQSAFADWLYEDLKRDRG